MCYAFDLTNIGRMINDYQKIMNHWHQVLPLPILDIKYEDMATNHEEMSKKIIEFVGLEWDDACLNFHKTKRPVKTASNWQVRQPVYTSSVERWRNYDPFITELKEAMGDVI